MMLRALVLLVGLAFVTLLTACATREQTGAVVGGSVGAIVGSTVGGGSVHHGRVRDGSVLGIVLGAMAGSVIGSMIGRDMDEQDRLRTAQVLEYNRTGQASTWVNPDANAAYTVTPTRTFDAGTGPCREFTTHANISGKTQEVYGTACRQADGSWKIVK